jgi:hypothetical protein
VEQEDLLTSSVDHGPDIRKAARELTKHSEWCIGHMENRACVEGFGTTLSEKESKFPESRKFFQKIRKVVETLNKSGNLKKKFQDLYAEITGSSKVAMLRNSPQHRWSSIDAVLMDLIKYDELLREAHRKENIQYSLTAEDTEQMVEFYALLEKATSVQKQSQYTKEFSQLTTFGLLVTQWQHYKKGKTLRFKRPSLPRPVNEILGLPPDDVEEKSEKSLFCELSVMTHAAMKKLRCALTT